MVSCGKSPESRGWVEFDKGKGHCKSEPGGCGDSSYSSLGEGDSGETVVNKEVERSVAEIE